MLARDPGSRFRVLPDPPVGTGPDDVLRPAGAGQPAEVIAAERGLGRVVDAAVEENGRAGAFFAAIGRDAEEAVVHWDGTDWTREAVQLPRPSPATRSRSSRSRRRRPTTPGCSLAPTIA